MTHDALPSIRLIYGTWPLQPHTGIVLDASAAVRFAAAADSTTLSEFARAFHDQSWPQYLTAWRDDHEPDDEAPSPQDVFDYGEWLGETWHSTPQEIAAEAAGGSISRLVAEHPELAGIKVGGASPGGHIDSIIGDLDALDALSRLVMGIGEGFTLERDDAAVSAAFPPDFFEVEGPVS